MIMGQSCREAPACGYVADCPDCDRCGDCCQCDWLCPDCGVRWDHCWCEAGAEGKEGERNG